MGAWIAAHRKAIAGAVAFLGAFLTFLSTQTDLGPWAHYAGIVVAAGGAFGVWRVPNDKTQPTGDQLHGAAGAGHTRAP